MIVFRNSLTYLKEAPIFFQHSNNSYVELPAIYVGVKLLPHKLFFIDILMVETNF